MTMKHYINKSDQMRRVVTETKTYFLKTGQVIETDENVVHFEKGVQEKEMTAPKKKFTRSKSKNISEEEVTKEPEEESGTSQDA